MEKVDAFAMPRTALAKIRWNGSDDKLYRTGATAKQVTPKSITLFRPILSEAKPRGIARSIVNNPEMDASNPMRDTEAPRLLAKKGNVGIVELLEASVKKMETQRAVTYHISFLLNSRLPPNHYRKADIISFIGPQVSRPFEDGSFVR
jgi:hypothetical protein